MRKAFGIFIVINMLCHCAHAAATRDAELTNTTGYNYNYMYPYLNNKMRTNLNPGVTTSQSTNPINIITRTSQMAPARNVVPRSTARAATSGAATTRTVRARTTATNNATPRRVVARPGTTSARAAAPNMRATNRYDIANGYQTTTTGAAVSTLGSQRTSSTHCLASYSECMDQYCVRENTKYNRCYCSAKLSQIDSKYQTKIDSLITQIQTLKNTSYWSDEEMDEYWMSVFGKYSDTNSWENIDSALDIDWASLDNRLRGQSSFTTGHEYCVQYLRGCEYMASNLRDAYLSEITRDCATYEQYMQNIQNAAESIIEAYK